MSIYVPLSSGTLPFLVVSMEVPSSSSIQTLPPLKVPRVSMVQFSDHVLHVAVVVLVVVVLVVVVLL